MEVAQWYRSEAEHLIRHLSAVVSRQHQKTGVAPAESVVMPKSLSRSPPHHEVEAVSKCLLS